jgi:outer membrane lipoprotein-sorting protein
VADRIETAYGRLRSYACDIEGIYFDEGREYERYVFRFYFRKPDRFRIEFKRPYAGVTIFYTEGEKEFTARPFSAFPSVQFRFYVDNPLFKSPAGQGVHQMHLLYFLDFLRKNAKALAQEQTIPAGRAASRSGWRQGISGRRDPRALPHHVTNPFSGFPRFRAL